MMEGFKRLGEACSAARRPQEAEEFMQAAGQIYRQVPGKEHPLYYDDWAQLSEDYIDLCH